jgi:Type III restriction enzyme, res subunit
LGTRLPSGRGDIVCDRIKRNYSKTRAKFSAGTRSIIVVSPTGSRKTILFCSADDGAMRNGKRCLVFTHRREIAEQTSGALAGFAVLHGMVMAGTKPAPGLPVQVASISTLMQRLDEYSNVNLLVIDEAHHSTARTWRRVIDAMPRGWWRWRRGSGSAAVSCLGYASRVAREHGFYFELRGRFASRTPGPPNKLHAGSLECGDECLSGFGANTNVSLNSFQSLDHRHRNPGVLPLRATRVTLDST